MMILLDPNTGLAVNPAFVASIRLTNYNANQHLVITMKDGYETRIADNRAQGVNVRDLHRQVLEAV